MTEVAQRQRLQDVPIPQRMQKLPRNKVGYVVPWFVAEIDGEWDFRVLREDYYDAYRFQLCTLCGQRLGSYVVFVVGPMCTINRVSAELPNHRECSEYATKACPFIAVPKMVRRETGLPEDHYSPGIMVKRNPGVTALWQPKPGSWQPFRAGEHGVLFDIGEPQRVEWMAEGRAATREEVETSIQSGYPLLVEQAVAQSVQAVRELERQRKEAEQLLPTA